MATTVSLVLGSGGARGHAHIGVIEELLRRDYQIIALAGSSMGALVGGMYAAGRLDAYRDWVTGLSYVEMLRLVDMPFGVFGMIRGERAFAQLRELVGEVAIETLDIPYTAVATDLTRQKEVWFQEGPLLAAIRASIAIPGLLTPVERGNRVLVDGGLLNPVPIIPTVSAHADIIVAVNLSAPPVTRGGVGSQEAEVTEVAAPSPNPWLARLALNEGRADKTLGKAATIGRLEVIYQSVEVMQSTLTQYKIAGYPPDVLIEIPKEACRFYEFHRAREMIEIGREAARQVLDRYEAGGDHPTPGSAKAEIS